MTATTPLLLRPEDAAGALGISRSRLFELLASGAIESVRIGRSRRIPREALEVYVRSLTEHSAGGGAA